ncbi:MAG: CBS domain-containing protein [Rhodospirillaceae bacterium]|jgi:CBS-domain-containing membrane protein|nr:CBS domain-containing protein [Rhodospirillaceae bacterium]MBT4937506.1 CBS domain-containing protein [Rhodospirillaceae bacterium]MBT5939911.1 CBS domain-containing protein [Rhodospirillaceae bacterium]MBT7268897.1 CBS domain-containing protein [Rhodospirillaceae bacterium]
MLARDIMTNKVISVGPNKPINEIAKLLSDRRISAVPVVDKNKKLLGIVSEGDLVHRILGDHELPRSWWLSFVGDLNDVPQEYIRSHGKTAKDVMTKDVATATEQDSIPDIAELLETKRIKRVPIVKDGVLVGIVSRANIIQALVAQKKEKMPEVKTSDQEIRKILLKEIGNHAWANHATLNVIVSDGVIRYWGFVESEDARNALQLAAENIPGAKGIEDNLSILSTQVLSHGL